MAEILLIDGAKYKSLVFNKEDEFEEIVKKHSKEIFGNDTLYIDIKKRIETESGIISIPDGYLIDFSYNSLWIVEVELSNHPVYKHLVPQLSKFMSSAKKDKAQKEIIETLYSAITNDILLDALVKKRLGSKDLHHFLSELLKEGIHIIVVIDKLDEKVEEAFENFKEKVNFVELKTFVRADAGVGVHAHLVKVPSGWEEDILPIHAVYDKEEKAFRCNCGGEAHKNSSTYDAGEIVEHIWLAHGISPENQIIEGWEDKFEKQAMKYLVEKYVKKKRRHKQKKS